MELKAMLILEYIGHCWS